MAEETKRESLGSRLGFILLSAGCAIGLGNVWRFPYITGKNGGAAFVLIYLVFLVILGLPVMVMEFSIGRASRKNIGLAMKELEPKGTKWHIYGPFAVAGNYILMMFYTVIAGWILYYMLHSGASQDTKRRVLQRIACISVEAGTVDGHRRCTWDDCLQPRT